MSLKDKRLRSIATGPGNSARCSGKMARQFQRNEMELEIQNHALREKLSSLELTLSRYLAHHEYFPAACLTLHGTEQIAEINLIGASLLGADRQSILSQRFSAYLAPADKNRWQHIFQHAWRNGQRQGCELELLRPDGGTVAVKLDCLKFPSGHGATVLRLALTEINGYRQVTQALQKYGSLPEENPEPVLRIAADDTLLFANTAAYSFLAALGESPKQIPADLGKLVATAYRSGKECEDELFGSDGRSYWVGAVRPKAAQHVNIYVGSLAIGWRHVRALEEYNAYFRTLANSAPTLMWIFDLDGNCTWVNKQWLAFTGRTMEQEFGKGWLESLHADDLLRWQRRYADVFARRERFEVEYRLRRADGRYRWVLASGVPRYGADQEFLGYIGSCSDITRVKRAEEDLNRAQSVGQIGSWRFDLKRRRFRASQECQRIFGVLPGTPLSYPVLLAQVHPEDRKSVDATWRAWLQGEAYDIEHRLLVDGEVKWVRERAEHQFDAHQALIGGFGVVQDITRRRLTLAKLSVANQALETIAAEQAEHLHQLVRELTQVEQRERDHLYEVLHDEAQPLLVAARLSLSSLTPSSSPSDCLHIAAQACGHISQVIQVARTLSLQLSPPLIRERGLMPALESLCHWVKDNHGLEIALTGAADVEPNDLATRLLCFNAIRELLLNVVKHAGTTRVTLAVQRVDQSSLRIVVTDCGFGFDPAIGTKGTGLLGIARRLGMFGGSLKIDSRPGAGTVATLSLPVAARQGEMLEHCANRRVSDGKVDRRSNKA